MIFHFFHYWFRKACGIHPSLCCREHALYHLVPINISSLNNVAERKLREHLFSFTEMGIRFRGNMHLKPGASLPFSTPY